jgi:hypothetical protein
MSHVQWVTMPVENIGQFALLRVAGSEEKVDTVVIVQA